MSVDVAILAEKIISYGVLGIYSIVITIAYFKKDTAFIAEKEARIGDANNFSTKALELQSKVMDSVNKVGDITEELRKMQLPRGGGLR